MQCCASHEYAIGNRTRIGSAACDSMHMQVCTHALNAAAAGKGNAAVLAAAAPPAKLAPLLCDRDP